MKKRKGVRWILLAALAVALGFAAGMTLLRFYPAIQSLMQPEHMDAFRTQLQSYGALGVVVLTGAQFLQVLSGIIPALPIQIASGLTYGALWGLLVCLSGIALGSTLVFVAVKRYGRPVVDRMFSLEKQKKLAFLYDAHRLERIVFILYFIPAMPKDVFNYLAALTPLSLRRYLTITLIARVPTILCSTFASDALMEGNYLQAAAVFCVTAALGLLCMFASPKILQALERHSKKH